MREMGRARRPQRTLARHKLYENALRPVGRRRHTAVELLAKLGRRCSGDGEVAASCSTHRIPPRIRPPEPSARPFAVSNWRH